MQKPSYEPIFSIDTMTSRPRPRTRRPLHRVLLAALLSLLPGLAGPGLSQAALSIYLPPSSLAHRAPLILEGTVTRTASGYDPDTTRLATYTTLQVDTLLRGPAGLKEVVIREPGGRYGSLAHHLDAVPVYRAGEKVLVFLTPTRDGSLETAGLFFGKFSLTPTRRGTPTASRDLSGAGLITGFHATGPSETFRAETLLRLAASTPLDAGLSQAFRPRPPEMNRLLWDDVRERASTQTTSPGRTVPAGSRTETPWRGSPAFFVTLSAANPVRWHQSDSSLPVVVDIQQAGNPLSNGPAAVLEMERAMAAWTDVPEARLELQSGNTNAQYVATHASSPTSVFPDSNIILFNDPYGDITDPVNCGGVLAVGGYWSGSSPKQLINNVNFNPALHLYVIFNNGFNCFLSNPDNLAEVAAHELGHGIGLGHSTVPDAIMRASAYGNRGPRLGLDDMDGAHCFYPHTFTLSSPASGEVLQAGTLHPILWNTSFEAGPDTGNVDIDLSMDGGTTWSSVTAQTPDDGAFNWLVPSNPGSQVLLRIIRPNHVSPTPSPFPAACSQVVSAGSFAIAQPQAGLVPDGSTASPLTLSPAAGGLITFSWGASCSAGASNYALYEGSLPTLQSGTWDMAPLTCTAGTDLTETIAVSAGARYYLVTALTGSAEGQRGWTSAGVLRPASTAACLPQEAPGCS